MARRFRNHALALTVLLCAIPFGSRAVALDAPPATTSGATEAGGRADLRVWRIGLPFTLVTVGPGEEESQTSISVTPSALINNLMAAIFLVGGLWLVRDSRRREV